jgi:heme/copper-type cytochrome/quinol oxidase subunit 2
MSEFMTISRKEYDELKEAKGLSELLKVHLKLRDEQELRSINTLKTKLEAKIANIHRINGYLATMIGVLLGVIACLVYVLMDITTL